MPRSLFFRGLVFIFLLFLTLFIAGISVSGTVPVVGYERTFGGVGIDGFSSVAVLPDGGYLLVGRTMSAGAGNSDGWVVRLDHDGGVVWNKTFGGSNFDWFGSVAVLPDGGYVLAGEYRSDGIESADGWAVRLDNNGDVLWNHTYSGDNIGRFHSVAVLTDGDYILAGEIWEPGNNFPDGWILRINQNGDVIREKSYGGDSGEWFTSIDVFDDGGYALAGYIYSAGPSGYDGWVVRLEEYGNMIWDRSFSITNLDYFRSVIVLPDDTMILFGKLGMGSSEGSDAWLVKLDNEGNIILNRTYGGISNDGYSSAIILPNGNYLVSGETGIENTTISNGWILEIDTIGEIVWDLAIGGNNNDWFSSQAILPNGDYIITGNTESKGEGNSDGWIVQILQQQPTTTQTTTTTTTAPPTTTTTTPPTSAPITTTATTTTPASGVLIAVLCGLLVVALMLRRIK